MANRTKFGTMYNALDFAYGFGEVPPLTVLTGTTATGVGTVTLQNGFVTLTDGTIVSVLNVNAPVNVGADGGLDASITPTAVSAGTNGIPGTASITAIFTQLHGTGDPVSSATFGLQEAINAAAAAGGGQVVISSGWFAAGGTLAMVAAATVPTSIANANGAAGTVQIIDSHSLAIYSYVPNSVTVVAPPAAATSATVASQVGVVGTWTAITIHVLFTYVTQDGGESLASADYSFTATVNLAIGGTGPAAATGAVGYRVYMGANATTTCYLSPVTTANGTPIQCGPIAAFKIGTPFSVATANVAAALIPVQSSAFPVGFLPSVAGLPGGNIVEGPFAVTGVVNSGTAVEAAIVQLPAGYLNRVNKAFRLTVQGYFTPVSTATLILTVTVGSVYNGTETAIFAITSAASSGTTASDWEIDLILRTAATGAVGTIEAHGHTFAGLVTGTANLGAVNIDNTIAPSSAVDLTKQDYIRVTINSGTANLTQSQVRTFILEPLN